MAMEISESGLEAGKIISNVCSLYPTLEKIKLCFPFGIFFITIFPLASDELPFPVLFNKTDTLDKGSPVAASSTVQEKLFCEKQWMASKQAGRSHRIFFITIKGQDTTSLCCLLKQIFFQHNPVGL
jgi:hypothetical protein